MLKVTSTLTGMSIILDRNVGTRAFNGAIKESNITIGKIWHRKFRAKHFTEAGAKEYRYKARSGERAGRGSKSFKKSYTGRKLSQKKHTRPLVWKGVSEFLSRIQKVTATKKRARIVIAAPTLNRGTKQRKRGGGKINMREEMERVSRSELRHLDSQFAKDFKPRLRRLKGRVTKRIA